MRSTDTEHRSKRSNTYLKSDLGENNINSEIVEITEEITKENWWRKFSQTGININPQTGKHHKISSGKKPLDTSL